MISTKRPTTLNPINFTVAPHRRRAAVAVGLLSLLLPACSTPAAQEQSSDDLSLVAKGTRVSGAAGASFDIQVVPEGEMVGSFDACAGAFYASQSPEKCVDQDVYMDVSATLLSTCKGVLSDPKNESLSSFVSRAIAAPFEAHDKTSVVLTRAASGSYTLTCNFASTANVLIANKGVPGNDGRDLSPVDGKSYQLPLAVARSSQSSGRGSSRHVNISSDYGPNAELRLTFAPLVEPEVMRPAYKELAKTTTA